MALFYSHCIFLQISEVVNFTEEDGKQVWRKVGRTKSRNLIYLGNLEQISFRKHEQLNSRKISRRSLLFFKQNLKKGLKYSVMGGCKINKVAHSLWKCRWFQAPLPSRSTTMPLRSVVYDQNLRGSQRWWHPLYSLPLRKTFSLPTPTLRYCWKDSLATPLPPPPHTHTQPHFKNLSLLSSLHWTLPPPPPPSKKKKILIVHVSSSYWKLNYLLLRPQKDSL